MLGFAGHAVLALLPVNTAELSLSYLIKLMLAMPPGLEHERGNDATDCRGDEDAVRDPLVQRLDVRSERFPKVRKIDRDNKDFDPFDHRLRLGHERDIFVHALLHTSRGFCVGTQVFSDPYLPLGGIPGINVGHGASRVVQRIWDIKRVLAEAVVAVDSFAAAHLCEVAINSELQKVTAQPDESFLRV